MTNADETEDNPDHFVFLKSTPEKAVIQRQFIETLQKDLCQAQNVLQRLSNFLKKLSLSVPDLGGMLLRF